MKAMSLQNTLDNQDSILVKGQCREEYRKYLYHLILLFKHKISEGSLLEAVIINEQIKQAITSTPAIKIIISQLLASEIDVCLVELYVKKRQRDKLKLQLYQLKIKLALLIDREKDYIRYKVNSLVLFDQSFQVFDGYHQHPDFKAVKFFKEGNFVQAAYILESSLKINPQSEYNFMRRVIIGKILLQKQDLSGFSWLNYVIQTTADCFIQKYESKLLFLSGYKVLIVQKGFDPQIATIPLSKIADQCFIYFETMKSIKYRSSLTKIQQLKSKITGSIANKIANIQYCLNQIHDSICYPKISIEELDLRIELAQLLYQVEQYNICLDQTQRSKTLASQLDIFYWQRQARLSKLSALNYMRLGYYQSVIELLDRVLKIEPDRAQRLKVVKWKIEAEKFRTEESIINQQSELFPHNKDSLLQRSQKSNKSSFRSQKSQKSSKQTIETLKKEEILKPSRKTVSISLNRQLSKIRKTSTKSYQYMFRNREQLRQSLRTSYNEQPKCCLLF